MDKTLLVASLRNRLFSERPTVAEGFEYANELITSMNNAADRVSALTALHVVCNTIANAVDYLELPADNPAAGATDLEAAIMRLIDQRVAQSPVAATRALIDERINHWADDQFDSRVKIWIDEEMTGWLNSHADSIDLENHIDSYMSNNFDMTEAVRDELRHNITFSVEVD